MVGSGQPIPLLGAPNTASAGTNPFRPSKRIRPPMSPLATLNAAFANHRLIFLAGSGISRASGLPAADQLLRQTLDLVLPEACTEEARQRLAQLQPELVYEAIIRMGGDRRCLLLWTALGRAAQNRVGITIQPNAIHRLLVKYSHDAGVPLVTPNFDVMFEQAARAQNIPFRVYLPHDPPPHDLSELAICKIHGSIETSDGACDTETIWTTASEIATFNAPWMKFLNEQARGRQWCFAGYSGRDIDLLPHLAGAAHGGPPIIWIDHFDEGAPVTANARQTNAMLVEGFPCQVFADLGKCPPAPDAEPPDLTPLLADLAREFRREVAFTAAQRTLLHAILIQHVGSTQEALSILDRIDDGAFHALPARSQIEYLGMRANCHHEMSRYQQLGSCGLRMARYGRQDVSALIHGLIIHAESLRMRLPADAYYPETGYALHLARLTVVVYFLLVAGLVGLCLLVTGKRLEGLAPAIRHTVIEHGVRFLAIVQRVVQRRARRPHTLAGRFLRRAWHTIYETSHHHGYAAGMANAGKFLARIAPGEGPGDAWRIYTLFAQKTGIELLSRNEADAALERGDFAAALTGYQEYGAMALQNGNLLNGVKAMLGSFRVRELQSPTPVTSEEEINRLTELSRQVEGRLWQHHFQKIIAHIRRCFIVRVTPEASAPPDLPSLSIEE